MHLIVFIIRIYHDSRTPERLIPLNLTGMYQTDVIRFKEEATSF